MVAQGTEVELDAAVVPTHCTPIGSCTRKSLAAVRQEITRTQILVVCLCYLIMCSTPKVSADTKESATNLIPRREKEEQNDRNGTAVEHALANASISWSGWYKQNACAISRDTRIISHARTPAEPTLFRCRKLLRSVNLVKSGS